MAQRALLIVVPALLTLAGCSADSNTPELVDVSGTVTLDGKPIDGAVLEFLPSGGRSSIGVSDADGIYQLEYKSGVSGALPGSHRVIITTARTADPGEGDQAPVEAREELLPERYNSKTELVVMVEEGKPIDFELSSK